MVKDADILSNITILLCSWVKRMFDRSFHERSIISLFLIEQLLERLHGSLDILQYLYKKMPGFYREYLLNWSNFLCTDPFIPSTILTNIYALINVSKLEIKVYTAQKTSSRSVFRTQSTIYDGTFVHKKLHNRCLAWF